MDPITSIVTTVIGALGGGIASYLAFRRESKADAARTRIDLLNIVEQRTAAFIERLEAELSEKDEQITRLEKVAGELRRIVVRLLTELRRHDPDAATRFEGEMP